MAQNPDGDLADWDSTVVSILTAWGVQSEVTLSLPTETGFAAHLFDGRSAGWMEACVASVVLGESTFVCPVLPDASCDDRVWPVFVSHDENRSRGHFVATRTSVGFAIESR